MPEQEIMTNEEARKRFPYRPYSRYAESRFGGNKFTDDACLLVNELAARCAICSAPTRKEYLKDRVCPDCDGRTK